jgi:hypothetical protein
MRAQSVERFPLDQGRSKNGRQYRLLNRGTWKNRASLNVFAVSASKIYEVDERPASNSRSRLHKGHYGGSLDGIAIAPPRYKLSEPLLVEYKTHKEKSFTKLAGKQIGSHPTLIRDPKTAEGVRKSKPVHYAQMCAYGQAYGFRSDCIAQSTKIPTNCTSKSSRLDWNLTARRSIKKRNA